MDEGWQLVITGTGTSHGNPPWGLPDFWSEDPRDLRRRSGAVLLGPQGRTVLIDAGPDLAHQCRDPFRSWDGRSYPADALVRCDAVLLTHDHADHTHGLNDLRHLNRLMDGTPIPIFAAEEHLREVRRMFPYCFGAADDLYLHGNPALVSRPVEIGQAFAVAGLEMEAVGYEHGPGCRATGWLVDGRFAYCTDCKTMPAETRDRLRGIDLLVMTMLQEQPHPTHCNWEEARDLVADLSPRRTVFTHVGYTVRQREWDARLPAGMELAYDGLRIPLEAGV